MEIIIAVVISTIISSSLNLLTVLWFKKEVQSIDDCLEGTWDKILELIDYIPSHNKRK